MQHYDFLGQTAERDGDTLIYSTPDGTVTLHCTELEAEPMTRLVTSFEPKWEDGGQGTSRVVYLIEQQGDYCRLTVEHHDLQHDPEGGTADGWERTLAGLKTWARNRGSPSPSAAITSGPRAPDRTPGGPRAETRPTDDRRGGSVPRATAP